ncbi:MAG: PCMD domain-containing protein [Bacteroidales bacterium]|nr:PCMD domain-containing protein [Bacteroidales bacterium]
MKKQNLLAALITVMTALSCTGEKMGPESAGEGSLRLSVKLPGTKACSDNALITIAGASCTKEYSLEDLPELLYLEAGPYRVSFEAGEILKENPDRACWEENSYRGLTEIEIKAGEMSATTLTVRPVNTVVCVNFHESVESSFKPGFTFTVSTEPGAELQYTALNSGTCGYFLLEEEYGTLDWHFRGELQANGKVVEDSGSFRNIKPGVKYTMSPKYSSSDGFVVFEAMVDTDIDEYEDVIEINPYCGNLVASEPYEFWATRATVKAYVDESKFQQQPKVEFAYRGGGSDWQTADAERLGGGQYRAVLTGLVPATKYSYKLLVDGNDVADPMHFSTEEATQIPNGDFEVTSNAESSKYTSFYNTSSSIPGCNTKFWDSGNSASASYGIIVCDSSKDVPPGTGSTKSAVLTSHFINVVVVKKLAAGNIFAGSFAGLDGLNGKVNFGRPWTSKSRPTAVRLWYKYKGCRISNTSSDVPLTKNDYDRFKIEFALGNWPASKYGGTANSPVQVNTGKKSTFWDIEKLPETVASFRFEGRSDNVLSEWKQVTLPLNYKSQTEYPGNLYISIAASKYGDYFVGGDGSKLYVDKIEFLYE